MFQNYLFTSLINMAKGMDISSKHFVIKHFNFFCLDYSIEDKRIFL